MRQAMLALLITGSCVALLGANVPTSSGMLDSTGVLRFRYAEGATASLVCAPSFACDLVLQPGEVIEDVVSGNSIKRNPQGWIIAQGVQGNTPHVYLMPQTTSGLTNLIITTTKHSYAFYLVAAPSVRHWRYGFVYPNERIASHSADRVAHARGAARRSLCRRRRCPVRADRAVQHRRHDVSAVAGRHVRFPRRRSRRQRPPRARRTYHGHR